MAEVSVIVPARNAERTIGGTLAALRRQDHPWGFELIVVDDASSDATAAVAERAGAQVVQHQRQLGPAETRNSGVRMATGQFLAFTDADCEPAPGWLRQGLSALERADLVTGVITPPPGTELAPFDRTLRVTKPSPRFESANLFVRREAFERVGGFQPFAHGPGVASGTRAPGLRPSVEEGHFGEDVVFGWRVRETGGRVAFEPEARVFHAVFRRGPRGWIAERWRFRYFPALLREVPAMRAELPLGIFLSRRTASFDLALGGAAAAAAWRRPWPLLAGVPYAWSCLRRSEPWRRSAMRENLALVVGDAVGLAALLRGSAAARTLLL